MLHNFLKRNFYQYRHNQYLLFLYRFFSFRTIPLLCAFWFWRDFFTFNKKSITKAKLINLFPVLNEKTKTTVFDSHYIYHPAWAIRKVLEINKTKTIEKHVDFSSTLHFCTNLSSFLPVEFYDYRPAGLTLSNLTTGEADITQLTNFKDSSIKSLSCMHVVEHVGLGRYGDTIDPNGDKKAINELKRVCAKEGSILFVVPVGEEKLMFNAHRVYSFETIKNMFGEEFTLNEYSLVTDNHTFVERIDLTKAAEMTGQQNYGCGCFWFIKK